MLLSFTTILHIIVLLMLIATIFTVVYGISKKNWALAIIPAVSFVVFVVVVYAVLIEFISRM